MIQIGDKITGLRPIDNRNWWQRRAPPWLGGRPQSSDTATVIAVLYGSDGEGTYKIKEAALPHPVYEGPTMKLDRNINGDGKGKYALVRLRGTEKESEAYDCLSTLDALGHLDWGIVGAKDEFFVVKLRDKYAPGALKGYADAVMRDSGAEPDSLRARDKAQWAIQIQEMGSRAGDLSPFCKEPD